MDSTDPERHVFYIIDWSEAWRRFYIGSGLMDRDPVVGELVNHRSPFTWSELRDDRKLKQLGRKALNGAAAAGWIEGLIVPMRTSGSRVGLISMAGSQLLVDPDARAFLCLISVCLHAHVRSLVAREGFAVPPVGLTAREIEALRLVARGRSDRQIAVALGVAHTTAHEFVEKAKRRLKTHSRAELVAVATALGIIDI